MAAKQGIIVKTATSNNAKYKIKYSYKIIQQLENGIITTKYTYSKLIRPIKKYSYS